MKPKFFSNPAEFRKWLQTNHKLAPEVVVGFYKKGSGRPSLTVQEAVEQALCFGWIDSVLRKTGADSFGLRFTPRRKGSNWSEVNTKRAKQLIKAGLMQPAGFRAFKQRDAQKTRSYSYEQRGRGLSKELGDVFRKNKGAWQFFGTQPLGYRRTITFWVMNAKREETRLKRLERLIAVSATRQRVDLLAPFGKRNG